ncbi:hypothetical protein BKH43_01400 [Helicobacter sp. 13S00401-1]|uniref:hypothetical protein n=1 Tax=Helicobacter sp. 13S00401-1 TaxID=1905758 RepID=UPI000BA643B8|nr:hypothetical protein [Helicobacter sp. 13S00401-1]PAF51322.1 hypothetical protein BKH43_01400 [Helicobacter sp. 13S00401-1]
MFENLVAYLRTKSLKELVVLYIVSLVFIVALSSKFDSFLQEKFKYFFNEEKNIHNIDTKSVDLESNLKTLMPSILQEIILLNNCKESFCKAKKIDLSPTLSIQSYELNYQGRLKDAMEVVRKFENLSFVYINSLVTKKEGDIIRVSLRFILL